MYTKKHKICFAALIKANFPQQVNKKELKILGFSANDIGEIDELAKQFKTDKPLPADRLNIYIEQLKQLMSGKFNDQNTNFILLCAPLGLWSLQSLIYIYKHKLADFPDNKSPLFEVAKRGTKEEAAELLQIGVPLDSVDVHGYTALLTTAANNNIAIATVLLARGANVNAAAKLKVTSLHIAAQEGYGDFIHLLMKHHANKEAKKDDGLTPFALAMYAGQLDCATILARDYQCNVDCLDSQQRTPMEHALREYNDAIKAKNIAIADTLVRRIERILQLGADVNRKFIPINTDLPMNYFTYTFMERYASETLQPLDYELMSILVRHKFNVLEHKLNDRTWLSDVILKMGNLEVQKRMGFAPVNTKTAFTFEITSAAGTQTAQAFSIRNLSESEIQRKITNLSKIHIQLMAYFAALYEVTTEPVVVKDTPSIETEAPPASKDIDYPPKLKEDLTKRIIEAIQRYQNRINEIVNTNAPKWITQLTPERLMQKSVPSLEKLEQDVIRWGDKLLRLFDNNDESEDKKRDDVETSAAAHASTPKPTTFAIGPKYTLATSSVLLREMDKHCSLLLPFNAEGKFGVDVLFNAKRMNMEEQAKFERILFAPIRSVGQNQPGIKFLPDLDYACTIEIDGMTYKKLIVAEMKISNEKGRIALMLFAPEGIAQKILVPGPYLEHGFHDHRYTNSVFQAHKISFLPAVLSNVVQQATEWHNARQPLSAPPTSVSLWQPQPNVSKEKGEVLIGQFAKK